MYNIQSISDSGFQHAGNIGINILQVRKQD
jgi:hypothetical protein